MVPTYEMYSPGAHVIPAVNGMVAEVTFLWFKFTVPTFEMHSPLELMLHPLVKAWYAKYHFLDSSLWCPPMKCEALELMLHPLVKAWAAEVTFPDLSLRCPPMNCTTLELILHPLFWGMGCWGSISLIQVYGAHLWNAQPFRAHVTPAGKGSMLK